MADSHPPLSHSCPLATGPVYQWQDLEVYHKQFSAQKNKSRVQSQHLLKISQGSGKINQTTVTFQGK